MLETKNDMNLGAHSMDYPKFKSSLERQKTPEHNRDLEHRYIEYLDVNGHRLLAEGWDEIVNANRYPLYFQSSDFFTWTFMGMGQDMHYYLGDLIPEYFAYQSNDLIDSAIVWSKTYFKAMNNAAKMLILYNYHHLCEEPT